MTGEVIKSFLVGLGFDVDDASLAKFNKAIATATIRVTALYASVKVAAAGILYGISNISEGFEKMGYEYRIIAPAINKALVLRQELLKAYAAAGINITKVIQASVKLNMSLTKTKFAFEAIYRSVGSKFFGLITKQSDAFRRTIYANMPKIQHTLEVLIKSIFKALEATTALGLRLWSILTRVYDFFVSLDKATDGWSTRILAVVAAWKFLNLSFLATPLGMLISGFVALLALWDDFKTFREGGQSLINWGSEMTKILVGLATAVGAVAGAFVLWRGAVSAISLFRAALVLLNGQLSITAALAAIIEAPFYAIAAAIGAVVAAITLADEKWKIFGGHLSGFFSGIGGKVMDFAAGLGGASANVGPQNAAANAANLNANLQNGPRGTPTIPPIGSNIQNSQTNQNVHQQTNINVTGTADANAVGKAVAGEQNRVNFDTVRNLKGATR